jgi:hypothetical protein
MRVRPHAQLVSGADRGSPDTRLPLTNVPLRELTSRMLHPPPSRSRTACTREDLAVVAQHDVVARSPTHGDAVTAQRHQVGTGRAPHLQERRHHTPLRAER